MTISKRIKNSILEFQKGEIENALIQVTISFDATAKKEGLTGGNAERCKKFIEKNKNIITRVSFGLLEIGGPLSLEYARTGNESKFATFEEVIYKLIRCNLLHEGEVSDIIEFVDETTFGVSTEGKIILPKTIVLGIVFAVICSPANKNGTLDNSFIFNLGQKSYRFNEFWGEKEKALALFRQHAEDVSKK